MNNRYFLLLTIFLCSQLLFNCKKEQDLSKGFIKYFGGIEVDDASEVQQTSDGGYIIIGTTSTYGNGKADIYVIKADASGNKQWQKTFGGSLNDHGSSVQQTSDGGYVFLGTYTYDLPGPDSNKTDMYVIKANASGDTTWTKKYGDFTGTKTNEEGTSIKQTSDGGYIIAGNTDVGTDGDMVVVKLNSTGVLIANGQHPSSAAAGLDQVVNILQRQNGEYVLSSQSGGLNSPRTIIIANNLVLAPNAIDKNDLFETSMLTSGEVALTNDGEYILTGKTNTDDIFLIKFKDVISNPKTWYKTYGSGGVDIGRSVQPTSDGGYVVSGSTMNGSSGRDIYLFKVDASGNNVEWSKTFGGAGFDEGIMVRNTSDGGYVILGTLEFGDDPSSKDNIICLIKVNNKGEVVN